MGEDRCPHCGHIVTGLEQQEFSAQQESLSSKDAEIERLRAALNAAKFRLFGAGPATDPLYAQIRDALNLSK